MVRAQMHFLSEIFRTSLGAFNPSEQLSVPRPVCDCWECRLFRQMASEILRQPGEENAV